MIRSLHKATSELDALKVRLEAAEAEAQRRDRFDRAGHAAHFRAGCVVWVEAILEELFRCLADEIRELVVSQCEESEVLHLALTMALSQPQWQSAATQDRQALLRRIELVNSHTLGTHDWPLSFSFGDGRTVNDQTFEVVWRVLRLPGEPFFDPAQPSVLRDLAGRRNRVAHGEESVIDAGRSLTFRDLGKKIDHVNDIVGNLYVAIDEWVQVRGWRV